MSTTGHRVLIGGTSYEIQGGSTLISGTKRAIDKGTTLVSGTKREILFYHEPVQKTYSQSYYYKFESIGKGSSATYNVSGTHEIVLPSGVKGDLSNIITSMELEVASPRFNYSTTNGQNTSSYGDTTETLNLSLTNVKSLGRTGSYSKGSTYYFLIGYNSDSRKLTAYYFNGTYGRMNAYFKYVYFRWEE